MQFFVAEFENKSEPSPFQDGKQKMLGRLQEMMSGDYQGTMQRLLIAIDFSDAMRIVQQMEVKNYQLKSLRYVDVADEVMISKHVDVSETH